MPACRPSGECMFLFALLLMDLLGILGTSDMSSLNRGY